MMRFQQTSAGTESRLRGTTARLLLLLLAGALLVACPEISVQPTGSPRGAEGMVIEVFGSNTDFVQGQTTAEFSFEGGPSGIVVHQPLEVLGGDRLLMSISIPAGEALGTHQLTVTTGSEEASTGFEVTVQPEIASLSPDEGEQGDTGLVATVTGANTHFKQATLNPVVLIDGVSVVSWNVTGDTTAEVVLDVALHSAQGPYPGAFTVYTDSQTLTSDFEITSADRWIKLVPDVAEQGETLVIDITGEKTAFNEYIEVTFDPPDDIDVLDVVPGGATTATAQVMIHSYADPGLRTVTVTDSYGPLTADFTVSLDDTPPRVTYDPWVAYPGQEIPVEALGVNTSFLLGATVVEVAPANAGLSMTLDDVLGTGHAQLTATVSPGAVEQEYSVTLSTDADHAVGTFWVLPEPAMTINPVEEHRGESVVIEVFGTNTHFEQNDTNVSFAAGSGLSGTGWLASGPSSATFTLHVAPDAPLGVSLGAITVSTPLWDEELSADFNVLEGYPVALLVPPSVDQGSQGFVVQANGSYTHWSSTGDTTVTVEPDCQGFLTIHDLVVASQTELTFQVDVAVLAPLRSCIVEIVTDDGVIHERVTTQVTVVSGATSVSLPQTVTGYVDGPQLYSVHLDQGEVLRARASCDPVLYLDPTLAIYAPGGTYTSAPLAENEDEHAATEDALIVYQAPESGTYYLVVQDRLGFEVGPFTLSLDYFAPSGDLEIEPNNSLSQPDTFSGRLLKGDFAATDSMPDVYNVGTSVPGAWVAVQVIARSVSPYETSGADVILNLYNASQAMQASSDMGSESPDPVLYILASDLGYIELDNDTAGLLDTTYWINLRPQVVINEVHHDEANGWTAGFVELYGEPGMDLSGCHLLGKAHDTVDHQVFDIDLTGHQLLSSGYLVIAHDDLVPGTGPAYIDETLVISDPTNSYVSIGVVLECNGIALDTVCWRGSHLADCAGTFAPDDVDHLNIGRGFHIDTDDNTQDFLPQPEPSPWNCNLREVW